jgi:hypothetical protein
MPRPRPEICERRGHTKLYPREQTEGPFEWICKTCFEEGTDTEEDTEGQVIKNDALKTRWLKFKAEQ